jgi:hypothetical protein
VPSEGLSKPKLYPTEVARCRVEVNQALRTAGEQSQLNYLFSLEALWQPVAADQSGVGRFSIDPYKSYRSG